MIVSVLKEIHTAAEAGENTQLRFTVDGTEYVRRFRSAERLILLGCPWMTASLVLNNQLRFQGNSLFAMIGISIFANWLAL